MKPLIVISPSVSGNEEEIKLSRAYFNAVRMAGGWAVVSDYGDIEEILNRANGILLSGGGDIEPSLTGDKYDEQKQGQISRARDSFELELVKKAAEMDMPTLGICRGMQVIGAVFGSHIIQHMEGHMQDLPKDNVSHDITIDKNSLLYTITGKENMEVNSFHHQAVGDGFEGRVSAVAGDGYIEALELTDRGFVLGVQWHPEHLLDREENIKIFKEFIKSAGRYR
ncbi:MAG: gamma-glutamyl-gamma-aminobutyrate hydrolase family protein [Clostridiales bacterium]|nr:gamma-glutamyl-gamma-aminobutyrate hydrolase family protein [Clostridiales bacterium]